MKYLELFVNYNSISLKANGETCLCRYRLRLSCPSPDGLRGCSQIPVFLDMVVGGVQIKYKQEYSLI